MVDEIPDKSADQRGQMGAAGGAAGAKRGGGPGRKKGGQNKHDAALRGYIETEYGRTPATEYARRAFMDTLAYARLMWIVAPGEEVTRKQMAQAAAQQQRMIYQLFPYTEKKMPTMLEVKDEKRVLLQIGAVAAPDAPDGVAIADNRRTIELVPANISKKQQKQGVSDAVGEKSDTEKSDVRL